MPSKRKASSTVPVKSPESSDSTTVSLNKKLKPDPAVVEPVVASPVECDDEVEESVCDSSVDESSAHNKVRRAVQANEEQECVFSGEPVPEAQAWQQYPNRYIIKVSLQLKESLRSESDYYYDMKYLLPYSSFVSLPSEMVC
ncbi:hypothetical protein K7X08_025919 [Anisodus acutangulus]|uniref:Uncharacterized protein n=1 Tax=Anisodus acutangulus TaxID=402998 RepID=A0A9Q1RUM0_9SOLA|nr:hypothetical protein K7X08_025919 [Anisodus acutangulus]